MVDEVEKAALPPGQVPDPFSKPIDENSNIVGQIMTTPGPQPTWDPSKNGGGPDLSVNSLTFKEIGNSGLRMFAGWVKEDPLLELQGRQGAQKYREMGDNSPVIGAILYAIQSTMRKVEWRVVANEDQETGPAQENADFLESCMHDMSEPWENLVVENISSLQYGYAVHEIVYKRRMGRNPKPIPNPNNPYKPYQPAGSDYDDGKIGWRRMPIRGQDTILSWFTDATGQVTGVRQLPWTGIFRDIPIEKMLLFRPIVHKMNPEGRPCTLDTKVRTTRGWTTMGDIQVGEQVFDEQGLPRNVVGKSEVFRDRPVYEIEFSTGATVKADACHLWRVSNSNDRTAGRTRDMTTEQLAAEFANLASSEKASAKRGVRSEDRVAFRAAKDISCGVAPLLRTPEAPLPFDPYVLGYWLGNGRSTAAELAVHAEDADEIAGLVQAAGFGVEIKHDWQCKGNVKKIAFYGQKKWASDGPRNTLRMLKVLDNKHVPQQYMLGSQEQRLTLLQGLMDSDGWSPGKKASDIASTFSNTNKQIIDSVAELVRSLGGQVRTRVIDRAGEVGGVINGKPVVARQTCYEVRFILDQPIHRLARKANRQVIKSSNRIKAHFIKAVRRVDNADTVCIEVDSPSHLFLVGESMVPTHNSILRTAWSPYYYCKRMQEQEAILGERMGGIPVVKVPEAMIEAANNGNSKAIASMNSFKNLAVNLRIDEQMGVVMPSDTYAGANGPSTAPRFSLELITPQGGGRGGTLNFEAAIQRYSIQMMTSVLADFLTLGHEARGSQSLAVTKVDLFFQAVEGFLNINAAIYNKYAIPRLFALNGMPTDQLPTIEPDLAQRVDLDVLSNFVLRLAQAGMPLFPDDELQTFLRDAAGMPDVTDDGALQAAGLLDSQLDLNDEKAQASLDAMTNPQAQPVKPAGGGGFGKRSNLEKILLASLARRMIRHAGPRFGVNTKRHKHNGATRHG